MRSMRRSDIRTEIWNRGDVGNECQFELVIYPEPPCKVPGQSQYDQDHRPHRHKIVKGVQPDQQTQCHNADEHPWGGNPTKDGRTPYVLSGENNARDKAQDVENELWIVGVILLGALRARITVILH